MKVAIHRIERERFVIVKWEDASFKWNGDSFRELGYDDESVKSYGSAEEVVAACEAQGLDIMTLLSDLSRENENKIWDEVQALLEA